MPSITRIKESGALMSNELTQFEKGYVVGVLIKHKKEMELSTDFYEKMDEIEKLDYLKELNMIRGIVEKIKRTV
jgi:hypothetical protein